jgi:hypothetical protein
MLKDEQKYYRYVTMVCKGRKEHESPPIPLLPSTFRGTVTNLSFIVPKPRDGTLADVPSGLADLDIFPC